MVVGEKTIETLVRNGNIAVVSDHLATAGGVGGAEKLLLEALSFLPGAPLYTTVYNPTAMNGAFDRFDTRSTWVRKLPKGETHYQYYLPLMPLAVEGLDLSAYDVVLSFHHLVAKGVITRPDATHICYCHSPARYLWDQYWVYEATHELTGAKRWLTQLLFHYLRGWDVQSANRVDHYIANSHYTASRIRKFWRREAAVVYPPVDVDRFLTQSQPERGETYLMAGRLVGYKRFDLAIETFNELKKPLLIVGDGADRKRLERLAGPTIRFTGRVSDEAMVMHLQQAKALIFPGIEDFGILPVEAMAAGTPVIAYGRGGILETVINGETGFLFQESTLNSLKQALADFEKEHWQAGIIQQHARQFHPERFREALQAQILQNINNTGSGISLPTMRCV